jgi:hypothetical protein
MGSRFSNSNDVHVRIEITTRLSSVVALENLHFGDKCLDVIARTGTILNQDDTELSSPCWADLRSKEFSESVRSINFQCRGEVVVVGCSVSRDGSVAVEVVAPQMSVKLTLPDFTYTASIDLDEYFPFIWRKPPNVHASKPALFDNSMLIMKLKSRTITMIQIMGFSGVWLKSSKVLTVPEEPSLLVSYWKDPRVFF